MHGICLPLMSILVCIANRLHYFCVSFSVHDSQPIKTTDSKKCIGRSTHKFTRHPASAASA
jgi:hypothetical protein